MLVLGNQEVHHLCLPERVNKKKNSRVGGKKKKEERERKLN
jgi:hypothetical protein